MIGKVCVFINELIKIIYDKYIYMEISNVKEIKYLQKLSLRLQVEIYVEIIKFFLSRKKFLTSI